ncbi:MAG: cation:proton antiporter [Proteobacteria bacterium]|nr:cation:proton antiporter [Pseudomonadota bacterium]
MHDLSIIITLAGALAFALVLGWITERIGLSALVGYMLAGVVVGPHTPGFVANASLASQMAEIGVILLMFGVGMHFHPQDLLKVRNVAIPGAIAQSAVAVVAGYGVAMLLGWSGAGGLVFGMALAVASTVVLMRMLVATGRLDGRDGHVTVGWLIVEDLFTVVALVLLPALATPELSWQGLGVGVVYALGKAALFGALVWILGTRVMDRLMEFVVRTRSAELFTVTIFVIALGVAAVAAEVFHVSVALGAFFAGLVVGQSRFGTQANADMAPFRDVFTALFFVSVGMLFDATLLASEPVAVALALAIVLLLKPAIALGIVLLLRQPARTALTVAVGLAQIGEFSFILGSLGVSLGLLPPAGMGVLVIAAIVSIAINPLLFRLLGWWERRQGIVAASAIPDDAPASAIARTSSVIVCGDTPLAIRLARDCATRGVDVAVVGQSVDALDELQDEGVKTVYGDPGNAAVLDAAGVGTAHAIVIAVDGLPAAMRVCQAAHRRNPRAVLIAPAANDGERAWLAEFGVGAIIDASDEVARALLAAVDRNV